MRIFGREPALILAAVSAAFSLVVSFVFGLTAEQAAAIVAAVALLAAYGLNVSAETVGALNACVLAVLGLVTRGQVSPKPDA
ncbi:hypothetical protein E5083_17240 [Streptomyces bauhiniae]|uniref:Uncharacterized protein n=1 Tax=Streptomyces bauhiniae TaxID=2340725 RepID=A0A4Z1D1S8_9ACTN|nr:hypothetical protein [Streptomyces bauhiniae]TGN75443.1 hypothetical protein E5083_17240 [Streptomyces bauhiniae]